MSVATGDIVVTINQRPSQVTIPVTVVEFPITGPVLITNEADVHLTNESGIMLEKG